MLARLGHGDHPAVGGRCKPQLGPGALHQPKLLQAVDLGSLADLAGLPVFGDLGLHVLERLFIEGRVLERGDVGEIDDPSILVPHGDVVVADEPSDHVGVRPAVRIAGLL